ncbi:MAG: 1-deoxy-D-xylulose-5-phosphate reductoisomerase [Bryobacterales bacterium]|nr:1-deoxy-D-xylulose-5-phosphate reductoisomerase [Bryobacterales bacterium]
MKLSLLGSTGSIGCNTLQVVRELPDRPEVVALTAGRNAEALLEQALEFRPKLIALADEQARRRFLDLFRDASGTAGYSPDVMCGPEGNLAAAQNDCDTLVSAAVGVAGMAATFEAVRLGKRVALANKETLVAGGEIVMAEANRSGSAILPVDSEHNAAHQCLRAGRADEVDRLILTASGGPFRTTPREQLERVTPEQALNHPTWKMGARITIDSSTLMNKGFEVIEACHLFAFGPERVDVVVHPQSVVHALVEYRDGSVIAQLGPPDMKLPIRYALSYPARETGPADRRLSWNRVRQLDFEPPDLEKFPLLRLAYQTLEQGGTAGCVLNAADEIAVESFLQHEIPYVRIASVVEETLERMGAAGASTIEETLAVDAEARLVARELAAQHVARV